MLGTSITLEHPVRWAWADCYARLAQGCRTYEEYVSRLGSALTRDLELAALGLRGPRRQVTSLTGDLPLYPAKDA
ncbi:DUF2000 family protein [Actinomyces wuliandei]|uniref:DUF2000 family protein n=1 Tax=Actinomyces wuliandei TaxID=2057743 RepID=UPI003C12B848